MAQGTILFLGQRDSPGTTGAAPCPWVEMLRRGWSGILWLQIRLLGASTAFQAALFMLSGGSSLEPPQPISRGATSRLWPHCGGKEPVPRFPVT